VGGCTLPAAAHNHTMTTDPIFRIYAPDELGPSGYPLAWSQLDGFTDHGIKDLVRQQAGHRCIRCHHPYQTGQHGRGEWSPCDTHCDHAGPFQVRTDDVWRDVNPGPPARGLMAAGRVQAAWRILTVHHLNGVKWDCRWWNLAALCQRCHLTIQGRVLLERVYPFEHSDWFKPYAAGWYAFAYLGEDLSRLEVEARLDELLALERIA